MTSGMVVFALVVLDATVWHAAATQHSAAVRAGIRTVPVAKGSAELIVMPSGGTVMVDAGPDERVIGALQHMLPAGTRRIDLAVITGSDENLSGGYGYVLDHYAVGAFLYNGRNDIAHANGWKTLMAKITAARIPMVTVGAGDRIHFGPSGTITVISPDATMVRSTEASDTRITVRVITSGFSGFVPIPPSKTSG